jgi:hypothetical protein
MQQPQNPESDPKRKSWCDLLGRYFGHLPIQIPDLPQEALDLLVDAGLADEDGQLLGDVCGLRGSRWGLSIVVGASQYFEASGAAPGTGPEYGMVLWLDDPLFLRVLKYQSISPGHGAGAGGPQAYLHHIAWSAILDVVVLS